MNNKRSTVYEKKRANERKRPLSGSWNSFSEGSRYKYQLFTFYRHRNLEKQFKSRPSVFAYIKTPLILEFN